MTAFTDPDPWHGPSADPNDEQVGDIVRGTTVDAAGTFDTVLVGEPYDGAVIGRRGAREGPAAIRDALAATKTHHFAEGPLAPIGDVGDVDADWTRSVSDVQQAVESTVEPRDGSLSSWRIWRVAGYGLFLFAGLWLCHPHSGRWLAERLIEHLPGGD